MKKKFWIKKRYNPQFECPYYVGCGQLGVREAKRKEKSLYGFNEMLEYGTEDEYNKALNKFKDDGFIVH